MMCLEVLLDIMNTLTNSQSQISLVYKYVPRPFPTLPESSLWSCHLPAAHVPYHKKDKNTWSSNVRRWGNCTDLVRVTLQNNKLTMCSGWHGDYSILANRVTGAAWASPQPALSCSATLPWLAPASLFSCLARFRAKQQLSALPYSLHYHCHIHW